ncbi:MAG TPA: chemotaxis protein CheB, partial [Chthoniobacteraceae bacterium]|nr:chemotaxis protein CheB [Chthoniobacteraceae bacterium]
MSETPAPLQQTNGSGKTAVTVVAIGASAGGLEAFKRFFASVPPETGLAFVLIQHLSREFSSHIPELLASSTSMPIRQVVEPIEIQANHIYVIAPNTMLSIHGGMLRPEARRESFRQPIDHFFRSLAAEEPDNFVGVILGGAGSDGALGLQSIKRNGGFTFAQDPSTCEHDSMPRAAIATGTVDYVLPIEDIAPRLLDLLSYRGGADAALADDGDGGIAASLPSICKLLGDNLGHDFSRYKQTTVIRRIQRRMHMLKLNPATAYLDLLDKDPKELEQLFKDLLISVTEFFRDREAFDTLVRRVVPKLFQQPNHNGTVRVWIPGCATGQEAYSIAILFKEHVARSNIDVPVQIFATDVDSDALETARAGCYGEEIADQVSRDRLTRFFRRENGGYRVNKEVREMCIFSLHNVVTDPPLSRMDLVSCRNLLIYFDATLQQRVIPLFHYALKAAGYLFLGPAESLGAQAEFFEPVDKKFRIFKAKPSRGNSSIHLPRVDGSRSNRIVADPTFKLRLGRERDAKETHERALLDWYVPPSVLIDANGEVLHFARRTSFFLEPPVGTPSHNVFDLVRNELRIPLRAAISEARESGNESARENIDLESDGTVRRVSLLVRSLPRDSQHDAERFLVVFREELAPRPDEGVAGVSVRYQSEGTETVQQLERELRSTKECLQSTIEELEQSNEELKSSNEELISINEEYQSANELLQTSKEEYQSLNEELETVNAELSKKVEELDRSNADIQNLFSCTPIAKLFLDQELHIKKFTPTAVELFSLIEGDVGRPLRD